MKTKLLLLVAAVLLMSCEGEPGIRQTAKATMKETVDKMIENSQFYRLKDQYVVFSNDSLCIIHADYVLKADPFDLDLSGKFEYVYLISDGVAYENVCITKLEEVLGGRSKMAYITESAYEEGKASKIYQQLDYSETLYYLASRVINSDGRRVGAPTWTGAKIPVVSGTGDWVLSKYTDEFGDVTENYCLRLVGTGVFSNTATTDSELLPILFFDLNSDPYFRLYDYKEIPVANSLPCVFKIKDSDGEIYEMDMYNNGSGTIVFGSRNKARNVAAFRRLLEKGGEISVSTSVGYVWTSYRFKFDLTGFNEALDILKNQQK